MDHTIIISDRCLEFLIQVLDLNIEQFIHSFSIQELEDDAFYHSLRKVYVLLRLAKNHEKEFIDCCQDLVTYINE